MNLNSLKYLPLKNYTDYINKIKKISREDLKDLNNRLILLDAYRKAVLSNSAYRMFINENLCSVKDAPLSAGSMR